MKTVLYFRLLWRLSQRTLDGIYRCAKSARWRVQVIDAGRGIPSAGQAIAGWRASGCIADWSFMEWMGWSPEMFGNTPVVFIDAAMSGGTERCFAVEHDSSACVRMAADELLSLGYGDYAFVGSMDDAYWSEERCDLFARRIADAGKRLHVFDLRAPTDGDEFYGKLGPWLAARPKPCGVFAANDEIADIVLHMCRLENIKVPESVAVIGVDDDEFICENAEPTLSSVRLDFEDCGGKAAELLARVMRRPNLRPVHLHYGGAQVVRRNSTRAFKRRDAAVRDAVEYVRLHACQGLTPAEVLRRIGGSRRSAELRFRDFSGRSIGEEITAVRLARVKTLLGKPTVPISTLHAACGYADPASLRRAFKKAVGLSPRDWRLAQTAR